MQQAKEHKKIVIHSDGLTKRSYMHSTDLAKVLLDLLNIKVSDEYIFNVGSADGKTLKEWAYEIADNIGDIEVQILNKPQIGYSATKNYVPNISALQNILPDFRPRKIELV